MSKWEQLKSRERVRDQGEVFTRPQEVGKMLRMVDDKVRDTSATFLEPAVGQGIFLQKILRKRLECIVEEFPSPPNGKSKINRKFLQALFTLYGVDVCPDNVEETKRNLFYEFKLSCEESSVLKKAKEILDCNIIHGNTLQEWDDINHNWNKKGKMKFDVIIGNPPYQLNVENSSAKPIYNLFIEQAIAADPRYIAMIVPSRWMTGGKGLDKFREKMLKNTQFSKLHDYEDAQECFPDVSVAGGINYFLWDKYHDGPCDISYYSNGNVQKTTRFLKDPNSSVYIREYEGISILNKVKNGKFKPFDVNVLGQTPYGISTTFSDFCEEGSKNAIELYVTGTRIPKYIDRTIITKNEHFIDKHKVNVSKANGAASINGNILSKPFYGAPGSACSQTYLAIGPFDTKEEADNTISYIKTKFFRFLVSIKKKTPNANRNVYELVPMHDMKMVWTDKMLYKEYNLDVNEIEFIEDSIAEMAN